MKKKFLLSIVAFIAAMAVNAQELFVDPATTNEDIANGYQIELSEGTPWYDGENMTASVAFNDTYKRVNCTNNNYNKLIIDGSEISTESGVQGGTNVSPAVASSLTSPTSGAVIKIVANADGWIYIPAKLSTNKQYVVFEENHALGYKFALESNDERAVDGVIAGEVKGDDVYNYLTSGVRWLIREYMNDDNASTAGNGLGVIYFKVKAGSTYLAMATGSKMSWCGLYYTPQEAGSVEVVDYDENSKTIVNNQKFLITCNPADNGTVETDMLEAVPGDLVTIILTPDAGYEVASLTVVDLDGNIIDVIGNQFTMPENDVTITATFKEETVAVDPHYEKVTTTEDISDGKYLIVYEAGGVAFNGALETLDATENSVPVVITASQIPVSDAVNAATFTIDTTNGTLKSASGQYIGITTNSNGLKTSNDASAYTNSFSIDANENAVIAAVFDGSTMTMRYNAASNQLRFRYYKSGQEAVALYKLVDPNAVDDVIISGNTSFVGSTQVTITCPTYGATIYYTTDGTEPTAESAIYTGKFTITETTTVKAVAIKNGRSSIVATKEFALVPEVSSLTDILNSDENAIFAYTEKNAFIWAKPSSEYMYLYDGNTWALVYDGAAGGANIAGAEEALGMPLAANWTGKKTVYRNQPQIVLDKAIELDPNPEYSVEPVFPNQEPDYVQDYNVNQIIILQKVVYTKSGSNLTISKDGFSDVAGYNKFGKEIADTEDGKTYDITGAIGLFDDGVQFWPITIEEHKSAVVSLPSRVRMYVDGMRVNANTPIAAGTAVELRPSGSAYLITATPVVTRTPSGTAVEVTDNGDGTYTFVMPNEDVEISAEVKKNIASELITVNNAVWTGEAVTPTIYVEGVEESNYTLSYKKDGEEIAADQIIATGEYTAVFTGTGNYTGVKEVNFFVIRTEAVSIPKETYVTRFFNGEMRYTDFYSVKFYVVSSVTDNEVVLSEVEAKQIPANTPFLMYNEEPSTINFNLLDDGSAAEALTVEVAPEFKGTDEAREFAETEGVDYYICNGKDFVYVKGAGTLAAHRCWLELSNANGARQLSIVINDDQTTGIESIHSSQFSINNGAPMYNINGQRVGESYKGIVIVNGKKYINK